MIKTRKQLKEVLKYEKNRYGNIPRLWFFHSLFGLNEKSIIWKYQRRLRKWEFFVNRGNKMLSKIYQLKTCFLGHKYGFSIAPNVFDSGLKIMHIGSILVNSNSVVGKNCVLHINTALVSTNGVKEGPVLGDDCILGVGSTLVGNIILGNEIVVGAGAVVTKSFQENHITLAGVPAKIISKNATM